MLRISLTPKLSSLRWSRLRHRSPCASFATKAKDPDADRRMGSFALCGRCAFMYQVVGEYSLLQVGTVRSLRETNPSQSIERDKSGKSAIYLPPDRQTARALSS